MTSRPPSRFKSKIDPMYLDSARLITLQQLLCDKIENLFEALGINMEHCGKAYTGCCPVHGGDNQNACSIYHSGHSLPGYWECRTKHCQVNFKKTIIGFVRGVLSHNKYGWTALAKSNDKDAQKTVGYKETIDWCCDFVGQKLKDIKYDNITHERKQFVSMSSKLACSEPLARKALSRPQFRANLKIPATYFVERGWDGETLDRYDVGLCTNPKKPFFERVVVPVYEEDGYHVAGWTGRSIHPRCERCNLWHGSDKDCPVTNEERANACKWRNSKDFPRESHLYNWWSARKEIENYGLLCLCEGPGDIWRLEEAGIPVGLGMFGVKLFDRQQVLVEMSGAITVVVLTNMDEAGRMGAEQIKKQLQRSFRVLVPTFLANDLGDLTVAQVKELMEPILQKYRRRN